MTRAELKRNARQKLGGKLFGSNWVNAVLVIAIFIYLQVQSMASLVLEV